MGQREDRLPAVDLVRLASILAVLAVHLHASGLARLPHTPALRAAWIYAARNGSYGVTLFFVVSGFVITRTILKRDPHPALVDLRGFYARRAGRILPLLILIVSLGAVALLALPGPSPRVDFCLRDPKAHFDAAFWASLPTLSFNWLRIAREPVSYGFGLHWDILWSLAIEEQFYLGYPLMLRVLGRRSRIAAALALVVVIGPVARAIAARLAPTSFLLGFTSSFAAFDLIAMGALLCFFLERDGGPASGGWRRIEAGLGILGAAGVLATYGFSNLDLARDRVWGPSAIGLSLCLFLVAAIRQSWFSSRPLAAIAAPGQLSYGAYLFHPTVLFLLWPALANHHAAAGFAAFAASTLSLAWLVYRGFEAPVNRAVRRRLHAV
jgi:peptidoglycan/LPS O-acetylase OafA/YrhL